MTGLLLVALLLAGASGLYLCTIAWCVRASKRRVFLLPWLLIPLGGALLAGVTLALSVPISSTSPVSLRLLELLAHLCAIVLIWTIAGRIAPTYRLAGTWLYAWNPLVLIELAVYANTAGVVTCLLLLAVWLFITGTSSSSFDRIASHHPPHPAPTERERPFSWPWFSEFVALALVGLAMRINFMTLLLAPLLLWFMVRHRRSVSAALMGFTWRALIVLTIFVLAYLPAWRGSETFLAITNGLRLFDFANSPLSLVVAPARSLFIFVAQRAHFPPLMQPAIAADMTVLATSFFLFVLLYLREMGRVRAHVRHHIEDMRMISGDLGGDGDRHKAPTSPVPSTLSLQGAGDDVFAGTLYGTLFTSWVVAIMGYIVLAVTVFLPGYIVWSVWVVALRRFDTLSVCVLLLSCSALLYYPLQWFAPASMGFLVPLCVFGVPLVYLVVRYWMQAGRMERKKVLK